MSFRISILAGAALLFVFATSGRVTAAGIYYTDQPVGANGSVMSVGLDGTGQRTVIAYSGAPDLRGIAWHRASDRIYFLDNAAKVIRSILPNGAGEQTITSVDAQLLGSDLEIDEAAGKLYWSEHNAGISGNGFIRRANLDGTAVEAVVTTAAGTAIAPYFFFVDSPAGYVYWGVLEGSSSTAPTTFRRANLAGVIDPLFSITTATRTRDIAIDPTTATAYWNDRQTGQIFRRALTGTINEPVLANGIILNAPHGIALDVEAQKIYWADTGQRNSGPTNTSARRVARCNFDGTEFEALTTPTGANEPWDLALDLSSPTYAAWRSRFFQSTSANRQLLDDADADGMENLLEYAFNGHPRLSDGVLSAPVAVGKGIRFPKRRISPLTYRVEVSSDLVSWRYNGDGSGQTWTDEASVTFVDAEMDAVTVVPAAAFGDMPHAFFRLTISTNEVPTPFGDPVTQSVGKTTDRSPRRTASRRVAPARHARENAKRKMVADRQKD